MNHLRTILLQETRVFVEKARRLQGVSRIALVGSLTTNKPKPKDADLLVTIDETTNIKQLAKLGRTFKGKAQALNSGVDIFLCNPAGEYLGRTCRYRECHVRAACNGQSCRPGHYICDDLHIVCLRADLIQLPPIQLWPQVICRKTVPEDVKAIVLEPLLSNFSELS
jgi:predicted nucleotidyltransferase